MLLFATFIVFALAMTGLGINLLLGHAQGPQAGCGSECECLPDKEESDK